MKVYVDTNDIGKTITYKEENGKRQYLYVHDNEGFIFKDLSDHTKQVRKEVCDWIQAEFKDKAKYSTYFDESGYEINLTEELFLNILKQAQEE